MFTLTNERELRREEGCLAIENIGPEEHQVVLTRCLDLAKVAERKKRKARLRKKLQLWTHSKNGQVVNDQTGLCLSTDGLSSGENLLAVDCSEDDARQQWVFQKYTNENKNLL